MNTLRALLPLTLTACTGSPIEPAGNIIAIGDSILEWNLDEGASIPEVVGQARGQEVYNAAISGTMVTEGPESIPSQYVEGDWAWLLLDGGGNDLNDRCGCGDCDAVMDEIVTADGTGGALAALVGPVAASGVRVAIMGYPNLPEGAAFGFDRCGEELIELASRQAALASHDDNIIFVDAREFIDSTDTSLFDEDLVHPSVEGGAVMGQHIAEAMDAAE